MERSSSCFWNWPMADQNKVSGSCSSACGGWVMVGITSEFIALALAEWAEQHGVTLEFIKPGKPMQNGFIERFNRSYREAVLDMFVFQTLNEVREQTETWLKEYNEERPHDSLGDMTPREYLLTQNPEVSTYDWS